MYFTTANPVTGQFAGRTSGPSRASLTHLSNTCVLLLTLAAVAAPAHGALASAAAQPGGDQAPKAVHRATHSAAPAKLRKHIRRAPSAATKVTLNAVADDQSAGAPPVPAAGAGSWDIVVADRTLNAAMARWAAAAGWQLLWELPVDYAVQAHTSVPGKFEDAVTVVVNSMAGAEIPMKAVFYSGNKVLRIMAKGAQ